MKKQFLLLCFAFAIGIMLFQSCKKEASNDPPQVGLFYSVVAKQAALTALTKQVESWTWDFGDGTTSSEMNPVHVYKDGGYYNVKLIGTNAQGDTASSKATLAVSLTPYGLMTGGVNAVKGKTWKLASGSSPYDKFANADATFTTVSGTPDPLPAGIFGTGLGMGEVYNDTYTFYFNGKYSHDVKADGASFGGIVYQYVTTGGAGIVNANGADFGLCTGKYTPQTGATFTYVEKEDFKVPSVYGAGGVVTYPGVSTLDFSGTEFIGFMDFQRKVIVKEVTDNSMRLVMFMAASPGNLPKNTHALILTFEVVK